MSSSPSSGATEPRAVVVRATPIELCQFLKFGGLAASGGEAKHAIAAGRVTVNGVSEQRKRRKLAAGDQVMLAGQAIIVQVAK